MEKRFPADSVVVVTTTKQGHSQDIVSKIRAKLALKTALAAKKASLTMLSVDGSSTAEYVEQLRRLDVQVVPEINGSMGSIRRQAIRAGFEIGSRVKYVVWIEPEKVNMVQFITNAAQIMARDHTLFALFNRRSLRSYPPEQALYYRFARLAYGYLQREDIDYGFGPMILTERSSEYFLQYAGEYGDMWDSILVARLRIIRAGIPYSIIEVRYRNHPLQTRVERGNVAILVKRVDQLHNVVHSLVREHRKLYETL